MPLSVTVWHWAGFTAFVLGAIGADLGVFHRRRHELSLREAAGWTVCWVVLSLGFAFVVAPRVVSGWRPQHSATFLAGYIVELALSMDNVFVISVIFRYFRAPAELQHGLLLWGVVGALVMRGIMILAGAALVARFHWALYLMGVFLAVTGLRMLRQPESDEGSDPGRNPLLRWVRRWLPLTDKYHGPLFVVVENGRRLFTPLFLALLVVETTDAAFAVDSIPAIFGVTNDSFLVFTSNIFAILGLRSMFFVLAAIMGYFRLLKHGLALVLVIIGVKMVAEKPLAAWLGDRLTGVSLAIVLGVLALSIAASVVAGWRDEDRGKPTAP